jgi:hypothetical protein
MNLKQSKATNRPGLNRKNAPEAGPAGELDHGLIKNFVI